MAKLSFVAVLLGLSLALALAAEIQAEIPSALLVFGSSEYFFVNLLQEE
jgi:hypothetical protein